MTQDPYRPDQDRYLVERPDRADPYGPMPATGNDGSDPPPPRPDLPAPVPDPYQPRPLEMTRPPSGPPPAQIYVVAGPQQPNYAAMLTMKSSGTAVVLEIVLGLLGIFGVGNMYAGRTALGLIMMISYWVFQGINILLTFILIGWVTGFLTWLTYTIVGPLLATQGVEQHNQRMLAAQTPRPTAPGGPAPGSPAPGGAGWQ